MVIHPEYPLDPSSAEFEPKKFKLQAKWHQVEELIFLTILYRK